MGLKIEVDRARAREVLGRLLAAYRANGFPYQNLYFPQDAVPKHIRDEPLAHALLLFYCCLYMRGTLQSGLALREIIRFRERRPDFFDPYQAQHIPIREVRRELAAMHGYKAEENSRFWIENSRRLVAHWNGDPRKIFEQVHNQDDLYRFVANKKTTRGVTAAADPREEGFLGFQKKMANMLTYFLHDALLVLPQGEKTSSPVDFHAMRIFIANAVFTFPDGGEQARYEELTPFGNDIVETFLREDGETTMLEVANVLWLLSNRLCAKTPCTKTSKGKLVEPDWGDHTVLLRYDVTCGACPLHELCTKSVQANSYYQEGFFEINKERPRPHQLTGLIPPDKLPRVFPAKRLPNAPGPKKTAATKSAFPGFGVHFPQQLKPKKD